MDLELYSAGNEVNMLIHNFVVEVKCYCPEVHKNGSKNIKKA
jgi:hypothetical protein